MCLDPNDDFITFLGQFHKHWDEQMKKLADKKEKEENRKKRVKRFYFIFIFFFNNINFI